MTLGEKAQRVADVIDHVIAVNPHGYTDEQKAWRSFAEKHWPEWRRNIGSQRWHDLRMAHIAGWQSHQHHGENR